MLVCPRLTVLSLRNTGKTKRVTVKVCNISASAVKIFPRTNICQVSQVQVVDSWNPRSLAIRKKEPTLTAFGVKVNTDKLSEQETKETYSVLERLEHLFSKSPTDLGKTDVVKQPYHRIPPGMIEEVRQTLKDMLNVGVLQKSSSPYCSSVVLCRKSDGSLRFCIDLRKLNSRAIKDAYTLLRIEETLDRLAGAKYFSKLDLKSGYW